MLKLKELNNIDSLILKYSTLEIRSQFLNENIENEVLDKEVRQLIQVAMLLVDSNKMKNRNRVLKISTIIPQISENKKYIFACRALLSKIKNYPTIDVIEDGNKKIFMEKISIMDKIREMYERDANSIEVAGVNYTISDIQDNLYQLYKKYDNISISAPTSIGKSFLFTRLMINELLIKQKSLVYIVPTRALINQILGDVVDELKKLELQNKYFITSSSDTQKIDKNKIGIFILTQERFYQLCNVADVEIGTLIIDEAQNIMDDSRGVLLEYSIKYAKTVWKKVKLIFISPFVANPEILLEKFSITENAKGYCEEKTTVRQNMIKLKRQQRGYNVCFENEIIKEKLPIVRSNGIANTVVNAFLGFNNGNNSIIYCNRPQMAIEVCADMLNRNRFPIADDEDLLNFAEFIELFIHKNYLLASFVRRGIVFHYGKLPAFIRIGIEELAVKGKFKIIACTPTLLQGVNIPAQNIYIYNPKKKGKTLTNLEFWNLAGRAGRMSYDLNGNVILIDNDNWEDINQYDVKNTMIKCATELEVDESKILKDIIGNGEYIQNDKLSKERAMYLESGMIFDCISNTSNNVYLGGLEDVEKEQVYSAISQVIQNFQPPKELLIKLLGISYKNIERLWKHFQSIDDTIEDMIISHPMLKKNNFQDVNNEFDIKYGKMLDNINQYLLDNELFKSEKAAGRLIAISKAWMREQPLKKIIFYKFNSMDDKDLVTKKVSDETEYINSKIRFKLVQAVYAYQEILKAYFKVTGRKSLVDKMVNFPMYLEIGACRDITVEVISMGLARELSIELVNNCRIDQKDIRTALKQVNVLSINNKYAQKRIKEFISKIT